MDLESLRKRLQQVLGQEFTVGPLLGEGGFAAVFRARDNVLNRDVAVKVLNVELAAERVVAERFIREAQTVARLQQPPLLAIYKGGWQGANFYLIMPGIHRPALRPLPQGPKKTSLRRASRDAL